MARARQFRFYGVGVGVMAAVVAAGWLIARHGAMPSGRRDDGYGPQVSIAGARVSAAESMMGGGVVYYDGTLINRGDRMLTGYAVELTFQDIEGKAIARDQRVLLDDRFRPLAPHTQRHFEIGFDHVPVGWNQAPPMVRASTVYVH